MIDDLFRDCERIAEKYEEHLVNVLIEFTSVEMKYKSKMTTIPYEKLLEETTKRFEDRFKLKYGGQK